jgi:polyphenol oxidase
MPAEADPEWLQATGLPEEVGGLMTTRAGGVSRVPFDSLNLRLPSLLRAGADEPAAVLENQRRFAAALAGVRPVYLNQVHGVRVVRLHAGDQGSSASPQEADASFTTERGVACTVLVADCLPVLLAAPQGRAVAAAHAGWRGLAGGVLEATVAALCAAATCRPESISAWLGACIGPTRFEVGDDVRLAFGAACAGHFHPTGQPGKWWADLPALARQRLAAAGTQHIAGGHWCTHSEPSRFFSFRREPITGRHAAAIWIR